MCTKQMKPIRQLLPLLMKRERPTTAMQTLLNRKFSFHRKMPVPTAESRFPNFSRAFFRLTIRSELVQTARALAKRWNTTALFLCPTRNFRSMNTESRRIILTRPGIIPCLKQLQRPQVFHWMLLLIRLQKNSQTSCGTAIPHSI